MFTLTILFSLFWGHWSPSARLPNFISSTLLGPLMDVLSSFSNSTRLPYRMLASCCLYVAGLSLHSWPVCASLPQLSSSSSFSSSSSIVFVIVVVHPLPMRSSWISLLCNWIFLHARNYFSFFLLLSVQLKYVIFMCSWLSSYYLQYNQYLQLFS